MMRKCKCGRKAELDYNAIASFSIKYSFIPYWEVGQLFGISQSRVSQIVKKYIEEVTHG
jgi:predicted XRE-type DNA-binding protein